MVGIVLLLSSFPLAANGFCISKGLFVEGYNSYKVILRQNFNEYITCTASISYSQNHFIFFGNGDFKMAIEVAQSLICPIAIFFYCSTNEHLILIIRNNPPYFTKIACRQFACRNQDY